MSGRVAIVAVGAVLVAGLLASVLGGGEQRPAGEAPGASAADGGPSGLSGWADLLSSYGADVELVDEPASGAELGQGSLAVLLDAGQLSAADADALRAHAESGGTVVSGGSLDAASLELLLPGARFGGPGASSAVPLLPAASLGAVERLTFGQRGSFTDAGAGVGILGEGDSVLAVETAVGSGRVIVLADSTPLQNESLASADDALWALGLADGGERDVRFIERVREAPGVGLGALPSAWLPAGAGLLAAIGLLIWSRSRRLGPPSADPHAAQPPRGRYVDAVATMLARSRDPRAASQPLAAALRRAVAKRAVLGTDPAPDALTAAAERLGVPPRARSAMIDGARDEDGLIEIARALAALTPTAARADGRNG